MKNANRPAQAVKEQSEVFVFTFSEENHELRNFLDGENILFIAKDACDILGLQDTNKALLALDDDEKLTRIVFVSGQKRKLLCITESGLYALILKSRRPEAKKFKKWITSEVLPTLRKKGRYTIPQSQKDDYIDHRNLLHRVNVVDGTHLRQIDWEGKEYTCIVDLNKLRKTTTGTNQQAESIGAHAQKFWLRGATNPQWFADQLGCKLLLAGARVSYLVTNQLNLGL